MSGPLLRKFGMLSVAIMAFGVAPSARAQCGRNGQIPILYMGIASIGAKPPARGTVLTAARLPEAFVFCGPDQSQGLLKEVSIVQLRHAGRDLIHDSSPGIVSFEKLRTRGYLSFQDNSLYGRVLTSQLICPGCRLEDENHKMKLRLLHEFSLWGSGRSDYREISVSLNYQRGLNRFLMSRSGQEVHFVIHYPGKWGVNQVAIAECKSPDVESCLHNKQSSMVVTEVVDLKNLNSVKIQTAH